MGHFRKVLVILCLTVTSGYSQIDLPSDKTIFYWDVNASAQAIQEINDLNMGIKYFDKYGRAKNIELKIYDWKHAEVVRLQLDKMYGLNYYTVDLNNFSNNWNPDELYLCEMHDENQRKYEWPMKLLRKSDKNLLAINILVNPLILTCDDLSENLVEFYGEVENGKAPYNLQWYVMNSKRSEFLYQPKEETVQHGDQTSMIQVDQQPDYYVLLFVKDACGNMQQKMVNLICEEGKKRINSLFVEPMQLPQALGKGNK